MNAPASRCFDAHAHLQAEQYDADRDAVIERARAEGVTAFVCASEDERSSRAAVALAAREPSVWAAVGVHPHEAASADPATLNGIEELARTSPEVVAIGEIGLDYYRDLSPRPVQRDAFRRQLEIASRLGLPIAVHSRDAAEDTYAILSDWVGGNEAADSYECGQIHCFGYDAAWAERFLGLGFMISIPGTVTYPKAEAVRQVAAMVPAEALTVETDCPYLAPQSRRGKRNEPAFVTETVRKVAELRGITTDETARITFENAHRLFLTRSGAGRRGSTLDA